MYIFWKLLSIFIPSNVLTSWLHSKSMLQDDQVTNFYLKQDWKPCFNLKDDKTYTVLTEPWHHPDLTQTDNERLKQTWTDPENPPRNFDRPWQTLADLNRPTDLNRPRQTLTWPWLILTSYPTKFDFFQLKIMKSNDDKTGQNKTKQDKTTTLPILRDDTLSLRYSSSNNTSTDMSLSLHLWKSVLSLKTLTLR